MEINNIVSVGISSMGLAQTKNTAIKPSFENSKATQIEPESIWHKMASKYDVRSITVEETAKLSYELYNAGEISFLDHAILSLDPTRIPYGSGFLTPADSSGNRDLVSEFKARIDLNKQMGANQSFVNNKRILEYLERLNAAKESPINITV